MFRDFASSRMLRPRRFNIDTRTRSSSSVARCREMWKLLWEQEADKRLVKQKELIPWHPWSPASTISVVLSTIFMYFHPALWPILSILLFGYEALNGKLWGQLVEVPIAVEVLCQMIRHFLRTFLGNSFKVTEGIVDLQSKKSRTEGIAVSLKTHFRIKGNRLVEKQKDLWILKSHWSWAPICCLKQGSLPPQSALAHNLQTMQGPARWHAPVNSQRSSNQQLSPVILALHPSLPRDKLLAVQLVENKWHLGQQDLADKIEPSQDCLEVPQCIFCEMQLPSPNATPNPHSLQPMYVNI